MSPEQALKLITQATRQIQANYDTHVQLQQAIEVLRQATSEDKTQPDAPEKNPDAPENQQ